MSATFQAGLSTKDSKMEDKGYESPDRVLVFFFFSKLYSKTPLKMVLFS